SERAAPRFSGAPRLQSSRTVTSLSPAATRRPTSEDPTKPQPPVTSTRRLLITDRDLPRFQAYVQKRAGMLTTAFGPAGRFLDGFRRSAILARVWPIGM